MNMEPQNQKSRIDMLMELEAQDGFDAFTSYAIALELVRLQKINEAQSRLKEIIAKELTYLPAYFQLGRIFESEGDEASALHTYKKALANGDPESDPLTWKEIKSAIDILDD